jgi:hypothetical protein
MNDTMWPTGTLGRAPRSNHGALVAERLASGEDLAPGFVAHRRGEGLVIAAANGAAFALMLAGIDGELFAIAGLKPTEDERIAAAVALHAMPIADLARTHRCVAEGLGLNAAGAATTSSLEVALHLIARARQARRVYQGHRDRARQVVGVDLSS